MMNDFNTLQYVSTVSLFVGMQEGDEKYEV